MTVRLDGKASGLFLLLSVVACGGGPDDSIEPGDITTWAGDGVQGFAGDGADRSESRLNQPMELTFAPDGAAYISDWNNHAIRRVEADGSVSTLIGTPLPGDWPCQEPENPDRCEVALDEPLEAERLSLNHPMDVAVLDDGSLILAAWHNHKVQRCEPDLGQVRVVAGQQAPGFAGDGADASTARLNFPDSVVIDAEGAALVSDQRNNRVRRIDLQGNGSIDTVAGATMPPVLSALSGDGGPAVEAELALAPYDLEGGADNPPPGGGLALDSHGALYIADTFNHCIRRVSPGSDGLVGVGDPTEETIVPVLGSCGESGPSVESADLVEVRLHQPHDIDFGPDGRLYVADVRNHAVIAADFSSGRAERVAGTGTAGFSGDGGPAARAQLNSPYGIAFDAAGDLYVVDTRNNRIRVIEQ